MPILIYLFCKHFVKCLQNKDKYYREDDGTHFAATFTVVQSNATDT